MTKELHEYSERGIQLYKSFPFIYRNNVRPTEGFTEYLIRCGYKVDHKLSVVSNIGFYNIEILNKYKDYFLFRLPPTKDSNHIFELIFNLGNDHHMWIGITGIQNTDSKSTELHCNPTLISGDDGFIESFIDENANYRLVYKERIAGFGR